MGIRQAVTRTLTSWLPPDEQRRMATTVVAWLCADLPQCEQREMIERLAPRLAARIRKGQFGLRLVIYWHLLRLPPLRWLQPGIEQTGIAPQDELTGRHPFDWRKIGQLANTELPTWPMRRNGLSYIMIQVRAHLPVRCHARWKGAKRS